MTPSHTPDGDTVVLTDEPAQDRGSRVRAVLPVTPPPPFMSLSDLGFDVPPAGRHRGHPVGDRRNTALPQRPGPRPSRAQESYAIQRAMDDPLVKRLELSLSPPSWAGSVRARFPTFRTKAACQARATSAPGTTWPVTG